MAQGKDKLWTAVNRNWTFGCYNTGKTLHHGAHFDKQNSYRISVIRIKNATKQRDRKREVHVMCLTLLELYMLTFFEVIKNYVYVIQCVHFTLVDATQRYYVQWVTTGLHTHIYIYIYIYTHTHTHIYICVCVCVCVYNPVVTHCT